VFSKDQCNFGNFFANLALAECMLAKTAFWGLRTTVSQSKIALERIESLSVAGRGMQFCHKNRFLQEMFGKHALGTPVELTAAYKRPV